MPSSSAVIMLTGSVVKLILLVAAASMAGAVLGRLLVAAPAAGLVVDQRVLAKGFVVSYGGEPNEAIRYMVPETAEGLRLEKEELAYVEELAAEVRALEQIPLVSKVNVYGDGRPSRESTLPQPALSSVHRRSGSVALVPAARCDSPSCSAHRPPPPSLACPIVSLAP